MIDAYERDREEMGVGLGTCPNCDRLLEDCTCQPDADELYDRWRDAQMEEE